MNIFKFQLLLYLKKKLNLLIVFYKILVSQKLNNYKYFFIKKFKYNFKTIK